MYNATWTAADLRGRLNEQKSYSTAPPPPPQFDFAAPATTTDRPFGNTGVQEESMAINMDLVMSQPPSFEYQFPWGVWNDAFLDELELGGGSQLYPDDPLQMFDLL